MQKCQDANANANANANSDEEDKKPSGVNIPSSSSSSSMKEAKATDDELGSMSMPGSSNEASAIIPISSFVDSAREPEDGRRDPTRTSGQKETPATATATVKISRMVAKKRNQEDDIVKARIRNAMVPSRTGNASSEMQSRRDPTCTSGQKEAPATATVTNSRMVAKKRNQEDDVVKTRIRNAMVPSRTGNASSRLDRTLVSPNNSTTKNDLKDSTTKRTLVLAADGTHGESNDAPIRAHASKTQQYRTASVEAASKLNDSDDADEDAHEKDEETGPGAVHIPGSMGDWNTTAHEELALERSNQAQEEESQQDNHCAGLVVAVLAPSEAETTKQFEEQLAERVEQQLEQKLAERLEAERQNQEVVNAVEVEVEAEVEVKEVGNPRRRNLLLLLVGVASIVLVGLVVGVVVSNASPSPSLSQSTNQPSITSLPSLPSIPSSPPTQFTSAPSETTKPSATPTCTQKPTEGPTSNRFPSDKPFSISDTSSMHPTAEPTFATPSTDTAKFRQSFMINNGRIFTEEEEFLFQGLYRNYTINFAPSMDVAGGRIETTCDVLSQMGEREGRRGLLRTTGRPRRYLQTFLQFVEVEFTMTYKSVYTNVSTFPVQFQSYVNQDLETVALQMRMLGLNVTEASIAYILIVSTGSTSEC